MSVWKPALRATVVAAVLTLGGWSGASADTGVVEFGVAAEPYPPFTTQDASGKWVGFEIDLMDAVCAAEHLKCHIFATAYDGIFAALNAHKVDVIWTSVGITDDRKKVVDFTDKYYDTPAAVIAPRSAPLKLAIGDFAALRGKVVGVQTSTVYANFLQKYLPGEVTMKTYDTQDNANADLAAGRLDAIVADSVALQDFLNSSQGKDLAVMVTIPSAYDRSVFGYGVAGGVRKDDTKLRETLNDGIRKIRADGTYDRLAKKYFAFDVYGQ